MLVIKLNDHTEYYLNIMNVLDKEYETIAGYNIPELSIYSGIRLNFLKYVDSSFCR